MFFYNGKNFCLRGGNEQRRLKFLQLQKESRIVDSVELMCYVYTENGSKNRQGGFNSLNEENKIVYQFESTPENNRCHVKILDKYLQVVPQEAIESDTAFYLKPLDKLPTDPSMPWFTNVPIGRNRLDCMMKTMCQEAGTSVTYTNHSLRAYGTTTMFRAGVPQKLVQQCTGHKSLEALHQYERPSERQLLDVPNIMSNGGKAASSTAVASISIKVVKNDTFSSIGTVPNIMFTGCTFSGCSVIVPARDVVQNYSNGEENHLQGVTLEQILAD